LAPTNQVAPTPGLVGEGRARARELGIAIGVLPTGAANAITDVAGVLVGHCTVFWGDASLPPGSGPARTGVTAVLPPGGRFPASDWCAAISSSLWMRM
jgi:D-aminopeptidase